MNIESKAAASNALGAKTARPCDSCLIKRARWFCAADDAFLCHSCDAAVHSANQLATRHQRLRLETSSCKPPAAAAASPPPAWHHGFTKKARTPRQPKAAPRHHLPLVPELGADDPFPEENEEQLFCRVPVFDAFADDEFGAGNMVFDYDDHEACRELNLEELLEADVESLLGSDSAAGVLVDDGIILMDGKRVKTEDDEDEDGVMAARHLDMEMNWDSRRTKKEEIVVVKKGETLKNERKRMLLRLNYEAVIAAWASQGCPWTDGIRPQFHEFMWLGGSMSVVGAGREARVSRYREKRRRRLFSKKIRYQVRKLNAEKRPRMKGRFVKRTPPYFDSTSSSLPNYHFINNKSSII